MKKHEVERAIGGLNVSSIVGKLVNWMVFVVFLVPAANVIGFGNLSELLLTFAIWFPNLIFAVAIILIGLVLAHTFAEAVGKAKKLKGIQGIKTIVYLATIIIFADVALRQIGVNVVFAETILLIIVSGLMVAFAIGFGLGLRPHAQDIIGKWRKKLS